MELVKYCRWNDCDGVVTELKNRLDFDLTHDKGICFFYAIKNNNIKMFNLLMDYYTKQNLQGNYDDMSYKIAKMKLRDLLKEISELGTVTAVLTEEMKEELDLYIRSNHSDSESNQSTESELEDYVGPHFRESEDTIDSAFLPLTAASLKLMGEGESDDSL